MGVAVGSANARRGAGCGLCVRAEWAWLGCGCVRRVGVGCEWEGGL